MATSRFLISAAALGAALWASGAPAADPPGARPGDDAMTCEQIAGELAPYMQGMLPNLQAFAAFQQQQVAQAPQKLAKRQAEHEMLTPLATAGALDPTGVSKRAYAKAVQAQAAKEQAENEAAANSPQAKEAAARSQQLAAQGQQLQGNARLQRLMQLGQQKGCTRKR